MQITVSLGSRPCIWLWGNNLDIAKVLIKILWCIYVGVLARCYWMQGFKRETRFTSKCPANEIINKIEEAAKPLGFDVHKKNYKVRKCSHYIVLLLFFQLICFMIFFLGDTCGYLTKSLR
jgi:hypothetical protein